MGTAILIDAWVLSGVADSFSPIGLLQRWIQQATLVQDLLLLLVLAVGVAIAAGRRKLSVNEWILGGCFAAYVAACMGTVLSVGDDTVTRTGATSIAAAVLLGLLTGFTFRQVGTALSVAKVLAVVVAILTVVLYKSASNIIWSGQVARASGPFQDTAVTATLLAVFLPLMLQGCLEEGNTNPLGPVLGAALALGALVLTWMRDSFVAVGLAAVFLTRRTRFGWKLPAALVVVFALLTVGTVAMRSRGARNSVSVSRSTDGHMQAWREGLSVFEKRPLTGIGVSAAKLPISHPATKDLPGKKTLNEPKSVYVELLMDLGIVGAVLMAVCATMLFRIGRASRSPHKDSLMAAWIVLAVLGIFDTVVFCDRFGPNVLVGMLAALTMVMSSEEAPPPNVPVGEGALAEAV